MIWPKDLYFQAARFLYSSKSTANVELLQPNEVCCMLQLAMFNYEVLVWTMLANVGIEVARFRWHLRML